MRKPPGVPGRSLLENSRAIRIAGARAGRDRDFVQLGDFLKIVRGLSEDALWASIGAKKIYAFHWIIPGRIGFFLWSAYRCKDLQ